MSIRLTPTPQAAGQKYGWLEKYVAAQIRVIRANDTFARLPKRITFGGAGDDYAYIRYSRNEVRDIILQHFANDKMVIATIQ